MTIIRRYKITVDIAITEEAGFEMSFTSPFGRFVTRLTEKQLAGKLPQDQNKQEKFFVWLCTDAFLSRTPTLRFETNPLDSSQREDKNWTKARENANKLREEDE